MMEYWNNDLKKMTFLYLIPVKRNFTTTQISIFPGPNIPVFQHSNCERSELTWVLPDIGHKGPFDHPERGGRVFVQAYDAAVLEFKHRRFHGSCY
jgi:hypothetical protein